MCTILLSIHPEYVDKILSGEKKYEFRRIRTKRNPDKIIIYSTAPISKVIGEAEIEDVIIDNPTNVWKKTKKESGINKEVYIEYFNNREIAVAYKLKNVIKYSNPIELESFGVKAAPQSFVYI